MNRWDVTPDSVTAAKRSVRERIWRLLDAQGAVQPAGAAGHIPSFVGAEAAADRLTELPAWAVAEVVKSNPDRAQLPVRVRALSAYGTSMGLAAAGGQLIGGGLIALDPLGLGWRACFLINVPVGVAALALAPRLIPDSPRNRQARLDFGGTVLASAALTALVLPLVEGRQNGWPVWTWICLALAPLLVSGFVIQQRRVRGRGGSSLVDLSLFRARSFSASPAPVRRSRTTLLSPGPSSSMCRAATLVPVCAGLTASAAPFTTKSLMPSLT